MSLSEIQRQFWISSAHIPFFHSRNTAVWIDLAWGCSQGDRVLMSFHYHAFDCEYISRVSRHSRKLRRHEAMWSMRFKTCVMACVDMSINWWHLLDMCVYATSPLSVSLSWGLAKFLWTHGIIWTSIMGLRQRRFYHGTWRFLSTKIYTTISVAITTCCKTKWAVCRLLISKTTSDIIFQLEKTVNFQ